MQHRHACLTPAIVLGSLLVFVHSAGASAPDDYVAAPDDHYAFARVARAGYDDSTLTTSHMPCGNATRQYAFQSGLP